LIIAMEEYEHLLSEGTKELVLDSLHNATKGDEYRVGGVDDDNLYPAYSNPVSFFVLIKVWARADLFILVYHESICVRVDRPSSERGKHDSFRREVCGRLPGVIFRVLH